MPRRALPVLLIVTLLILSSVGFFIWKFSKPRVVTRAVAPDGTEMCVVQQIGEPFSTSFVYRKPGKQWGWFYYDHEDSYCGSAETQLDVQHHPLTVLRDGKPTALFDWESEVYTLTAFDRRLTNAQRWLPFGWSPTKSVYTPFH